MVLTGRSALSGTGIEVEVSADRVVGLRPAEVPDEAPFVAPGFIDLQVNGYRGIDYSAEMISPDDVAEIVSLLATSGTTTHVPTIITNSRERILQSIATVAAGLASPRAAELPGGIDGAVAGIHIEGPYISEEDGPRGAHDARFVRDPSIAEYEQWQEAADGRITIVTLAPERQGALPFIERLAADGVVVGIGHTRAEPSLIAEAVAAGARLSTHIGNGSPLQMPRLHNHLWPQLADDRLAAGLVADGFHVPLEFVQVVFRAKGEDNVILVSDVAPLAGYEPGRHSWGSIEVEVFADGHLQVADTEYLAGAGYLLDRCIAEFAGIAAGVVSGSGGLSAAVRGATVNPARLLGLTDFAGGLALGARANLVLFRTGVASPLSIRRVVRNGVIVVDTHD